MLAPSDETDAPDAASESPSCESPCQSGVLGRLITSVTGITGRIAGLARILRRLRVDGHTVPYFDAKLVGYGLGQGNLVAVRRLVSLRDGDRQQRTFLRRW